jgi:hypothetical protein
MPEMKRFALGLLLMMAFSTVFSQRQYFIYLQTEPEQAFFVKMNEKIHSSTASGYLILSRLRDSSYTFSIGFPDNKWPEQKFMVDVIAKDHGFLLKNFGEKGWGLVDLQTTAIQMGVATVNNTSQKTEQKEVSVFTDILSRAANDPSLKEKPITPPPAVAKEDKKITIEPAVIKKEEPPVGLREDKKIDAEQTVVKKEESTVAVKEQAPAKEEELKTIRVEEYKRSVVTKRSESSTPEGLSLVFIDDNVNGKKDTISILIPNPKMNFTEIKEPAKEEKKFLEINNDDTVKKNEPVQKSSTREVVTVTSKNNCLAFAGETDFLKLRKKMAAETNDESMVDDALKYFKTKCFTTLQIKNLSALFLNDNGKYKFFDAAYTHVSDPDNFVSLEAELKDEYYLNRFKAMLR